MSDSRKIDWVDVTIGKPEEHWAIVDPHSPKGYEYQHCGKVVRKDGQEIRCEAVRFLRLKDGFDGMGWAVRIKDHRGRKKGGVGQVKGFTLHGDAKSNWRAVRPDECPAQGYQGSV